MNRREQSVRHLANLFTVVVGLGLSSAIYNLVDPNGQVVQFSPSTFTLCIAYIATLLPFYHGAMRHLDDRFAHTAGANDPKDGALLADFVILFIEGCWFLGMAVLIKQPVTFAQGYALLLLIDVAWGFLAHLAFLPKEKGLAETRWTKINLAAFVAFGGFLCSSDMVPFLSSTLEPAKPLN